MFWFRNKKIDVQLHTLIWRPAHVRKDKEIVSIIVDTTRDSDLPLVVGLVLLLTLVMLDIHMFYSPHIFFLSNSRTRFQLLACIYKLSGKQCGS